MQYEQAAGAFGSVWTLCGNVVTVKRLSGLLEEQEFRTNWEARAHFERYTTPIVGVRA